MRSLAVTEIHLVEYKTLVRPAMLLVHDVMTAEDVVRIVAALCRLPERQREALIFRYLSAAEIPTLMGIGRAVKSHTAHGMSALKIREHADETKQHGAASDYPSLETVALPISIYLAEMVTHMRVEAAVEEWLATASASIEERQQPIIGSWFRRMQATAKIALHSATNRDLALTAFHAADARVVLAQDATITATLLANLGPVIGSLQPTKDAIVRVGALLIVKVDWAVQVIQLTAAQQALLDHQPQLASDPRQIVAALESSPQAAE